MNFEPLKLVSRAEQYDKSECLKTQSLNIADPIFVTRIPTLSKEQDEKCPLTKSEK
jgi:hypothetical protein